MDDVTKAYNNGLVLGLSLGGLEVVREDILFVTASTLPHAWEANAIDVDAQFAAVSTLPYMREVSALSVDAQFVKGELIE